MRTIRKWIACGLIASPLAAFNDAAGAPADSSSRLVTILIRNYAYIADERLTSARLEADRILSQASVSIMWRNIPVSSDQASETRSESTVQPEPALSIQLLSASMTARLHRPEKELGFVSGTTAYVLCERLERLARNGLVFDRSRVLGTVLAHEIGHMLLGVGAHAPSGLMRPHWQFRQIQHADQGTLMLTPLQLEALRRQTRTHRATK